MVRASSLGLVGALPRCAAKRTASRGFGGLLFMGDFRSSMARRLTGDCMSRRGLRRLRGAGPVVAVSVVAASVVAVSVVAASPAMGTARLPGPGIGTVHGIGQGAQGAARIL